MIIIIQEIHHVCFVELNGTLDAQSLKVLGEKWSSYYPKNRDFWGIIVDFKRLSSAKGSQVGEFIKGLDCLLQAKKPIKFIHLNSEWHKLVEIFGKDLEFEHCLSIDQALTAIITQFNRRQNSLDSAS